jgi:hypothetical protein
MYHFEIHFAWKHTYLQPEYPHNTNPQIGPNISPEHCSDNRILNILPILFIVDLKIGILAPLLIEHAYDFLHLPRLTQELLN